MGESRQKPSESGGVVLRLAPEPSDEALVLRARDGDGQATGWLIERHAPRVTQVLARALGHDADLVDHAQEVLLRAVRELGALRDPGAFRAWITALAVTEVRRVLRRRARWRWLWGEGRSSDVEALGEDRTGAQEALRVVYRALEQLGVEERLAFTLRHVEGMELTEVADAMGVSLATAKRRLARADDRFQALTAGADALAPWRPTSPERGRP